jgi:hypothetical protein
VEVSDRNSTMEEIAERATIDQRPARSAALPSGRPDGPSETISRPGPAHVVPAHHRPVGLEEQNPVDTELTETTGEPLEPLTLGRDDADGHRIEHGWDGHGRSHLDDLTGVTDHPESHRIPAVAETHG